ncbi:general stress protein [Paenibacillus mendelii]|uniref:General stress protein n=1 Tax=Paenibacillus mendelii TaxID=206163 RepID=A0ABV6JEY8_9BACL|nr:general stress protein [Paenibacillus mendelii]MCQ6562699.1 general stress protein [Paenibacillus mendelii]
MAYKLGIFRQEQQVINAVQELEKEGFTKHELQVFAKDREHSRRVEAETDVHADELNELTDTRDYIEEGDIAVVPAGVMSGGSPVAGYGGTAFGGNGAGAIVGGVWGDDSAIEESLRTLGLDDDAAKQCRDAIAEGWLVVTAHTGDGNERSDGGQDLGLAGTAEAVFRRTGAERILE